MNIQNIDRATKNNLPEILNFGEFDKVKSAQNDPQMSDFQNLPENCLIPLYRVPNFSYFGNFFGQLLWIEVQIH